MPRPAKDTDHTEDKMDDQSYEDWETVSEGFGTKIEWNVGTQFIGEYVGTRVVLIKEDGDIDNPLDTALSVDFTKNGEKFFSWAPHQLKTVIDNGTLSPGQTVFIKCEREEATKKGLNPVKVFTIKVKPIS